MFIFDESLATLLRRTEGLGIPVSPHLEAGRIRIQQVAPAEMSPGEFAHEIMTCVEERQARVVIIDSLNGYLSAMPEERYLIAQLHELLAYLGQARVGPIPL